jgi:elongation factor P
MKTARELKEGETVLIDGELFKPVSLVHHAGTGQQPGMVRGTLRNMKTGRIIEKRWSLEEHLQIVELERIQMQFLYTDDDGAVFMHPTTFEQLTLALHMVEHFLPYMKETELYHVEFYEGEPVALDMPKMVPLHVTSCGQGIKGQRESPGKEATLENGMAVTVPHFIEEGDSVVIDVRTGKYVDRQRKA